MTRIWDIVVIVGLDIAAAVLGILAGVSQNRVCSEPSQKAFWLGLSAQVILLISMLLEFFKDRPCLLSPREFKRSSFSKKFSCGILLLSGIVSTGANVAFGYGTYWNGKSQSSCGFKHHLLTIGGILCFFRALFSVAWYVSNTAKDEAAN
ncbi:unnamed protein product [Eruca vesicaria subsp. sativa]|uniref:Uncharacterized protein n=1 Tax=Eruca vesicaria subsp. sativa TaxID=29727 RepID=A0ABC8LJB6_ERUVS|nr:unnamed protein product [Eruca vesicaria subsp. sativa]